MSIMCAGVAYLLPRILNALLGIRVRKDDDDVSDASESKESVYSIEATSSKTNVIKQIHAFNMNGHS